MGTISQFLHTDMLKKVAILKHFTLKLHTILPSQFVNQCQVADFSDQQLIVATTSSMWSHQLRYYIPQIQKQFQQQSIRIIVTPKLVDLNAPTPAKPSTYLDNESADIISQSAKTINHPALKTSLENLSKMRKK